MSTSEHVINLIVGAAAGAGGVYFQRKGKRYFYLYVLFWVVAIAMMIAAWYWIVRSSRVGLASVFIAGTAAKMRFFTTTRDYTCTPPPSSQLATPPPAHAHGSPS